MNTKCRVNMCVGLVFIWDYMIVKQVFTLTLSRMFLSALVCAVSFWLRTMEAFRRTFIANIVSVSLPVVFLAKNTLPYPPLPRTLSNLKSPGPVFSCPGLTFSSVTGTLSVSSELKRKQLLPYIEVYLWNKSHTPST